MNLQRENYRTKSEYSEFAKVDHAKSFPVWRVVLVHRLRPEENQGNHHVYVDLLDEHGNWLTKEDAAQLKFVASWEGRTENEPLTKVSFDKVSGEPLANIPIWKGQKLMVWVEDYSQVSDVVSNLHGDWDDEGVGNTRFHFSYYVIFQRLGADASIDEPTTEETYSDDLVLQIQQKINELQELVWRL